MKILFALGFPNPFLGAAWTRISFFANAWSKRGHSIEILGIFSYKSFQKRGVIKSGKVNIFNITFNMCLNHPLVFALNSIISFMVSMLFLLARKPNVVIVSVPTGDVGLGALIACRLTRAKCVVDYRDEWEDYAINLADSKIRKSFYSAVKKLMVSLYSKCHLVVAVTSSFMISLKRRGVTSIRLVPNGADIRTFKPSNKKRRNKSFTAFYSGAISSYYRLDVAVKALKKLVDRGLRNVKLIIAGEGEVHEVLNLALELGISNNVEYRGAINSKGKLAKLIAEADVGLVPYDDNTLWRNSLPAKFFEYCACGMPVIATIHQDYLLAELINTHEVGLTVPPMNEEKLAEAIYWIYKNELFRKAASKRARSLIKEKFDRNKIAEEFLDLVKALL